jgi:hypothetical protein
MALGDTTKKKGYAPKRFLIEVPVNEVDSGDKSKTTVYVWFSRAAR